MMLAYHNDESIKTAILTQLQAHHDADEIVQGRYWENGKGCAVGCAVHSDDHMAYESRFGIPVALARLEDQIFEGLEYGAAKDWPLRFMRAIRPGSDLSRVQWRFLHWLLSDASVNPGISDPSVADVVARCSEIMLKLSRGQEVPAGAARSAAWSAENAAEGAARSVARSAAKAAWSAASAAYCLMADKLIELLEAA